MRQPPKYLKHSSGQAFVRIKKKNIYLGRHGTPESRKKYDEVMSQYHANGRSLPGLPNKEPKVSGVLLAYVEWAEKYFVKNGEPTGQVDRVKCASRAPSELFGELPVRQFTVTHMEAVRDHMVSYGWTRGYINTCLSTLKGIIKWAGMREFITMEQALRLCCVPGLKKGRTKAPESKKIRPVDPALVEATLPFMGRIPRCMVELQALTGMRPNEVCVLRECDVERESVPWTYRPHVHKNDHRDQDRVIFFGPRARDVLKPFIDRRVVEGRPEAYLFSPAEALKEAVEEHGPWVAAGMRNNKGEVGEFYQEQSYWQAIRNACRRGKLPEWSPLQLRHTRATAVRKRHGLDAAQGLLGHKELSSTQVYAELDEERQKKIAEEEG